MKRAACFALLVAVAAATGAQVADKASQQAQEQRHGDPQSQEEQAGKAALQNTRKPGEQVIRAQPQNAEEELAQDKAQLLRDKKAKRPPRREVQADVGRMPATAGPQAYGPANRGKLAPLPGTMPSPAPTTATIVRCVGGMCTDTAGRQYQISGNAGTDSNGRQCTRTGTTLQCF